MGKEILTILDRAKSELFNTNFNPLSSNKVSNFFFNPSICLRFLSKSAYINSLAKTKPNIPAGFSVPERNPFSWPPPNIIGFRLIPDFTYSAATPFGP